MRIEILNTIELLRDCEDLQREVWGFSDLEIVSASNMVATGHAGGVTAGAFDGGALIGFVTGFAACRPDQTSVCGLHSHMLAVSASHRGKGVGKALKWFQRDWCLTHGLPWMTWTFDPLQARNANLNLEHLGATGRVYRVNEYGDLGGGLNAGLPTDRLVAFWDLAGERATALYKGRSLPKLVSEGPVVLENVSGKPVVRSLDAEPGGVRVAVPHNLPEMLQTDLERALEWRFAVRQVLLNYLGQGYQATRFQRGFYILTK